MVFNALQINTQFLAKSASEKKKSVRSTKSGIGGVRTQRRSHHNQRRLGAGMQHLASAGPPAAALAAA